MTAGQLLKLVKLVVQYLEDNGLLLPDGFFVAPTLEQDIALAVFVEKQLATFGVPIPDKVVNLTGIIPLVLGMMK